MLLCLTPPVGNEDFQRLQEVLAGHLEQIITQWPGGEAEALINGIALLINAPGTESRALPADAHRLFSELARRAPSHRVARAARSATPGSRAAVRARRAGQRRR